MKGIRFFPILIGVSLCMTGCVSSSTTQSVANYSATAGNLDVALSRTYAEAQQVESDNRIASALIDPGMGYGSFCKATLKPGSIAERARLADELFGYSKSLQVLVANQSSSELAAQSQVLFTNLSGLNVTLGSIAGRPPLTKSDLAIIATVVDAIGQAWIQDERLKLLARIVEQADPLVQQAAKLYVEDLKNWQALEIAALDNVSRDYFKIAQTKPFPDPGTRMTLLQKSDAARNQAAALPAQFQSLEVALQQCAKAHGALLASLKSDAQLKNSSGIVSDFEFSVQQVETFYQGVAK
jgi:hypothetical protein